jgi:hypothetical protein
MIQPLTEKQMQTMALPIVLKSEDMNSQFIQRFSKHIGKILKKRGKVDFMQEYETMLLNIAFLLGLFDDFYTSQGAKVKKNISDVSKKDYLNAKENYLAKKVKYVPYNENTKLMNQVKGVTNDTLNDIYNAKHMLGISVQENGKVTGIYLTTAYTKAIQEAINLNQNGISDDVALSNLLKKYGYGSLKVVYPSGKTLRLDNYIKFAVMNAIQEISIQGSNEIGEQFGKDGYEISVHENPAPDHQDIQGQQYTLEEYEQLNSELHRPIGEMNCYHYAIPIIIGINQPIYSKTELEQIKKKANEKISLFGKEYSRYECTQLQREFESKIRRQKEIWISAKYSGDNTLLQQTKDKIDILNRRYDYISKMANIEKQEDKLLVKDYPEK